MKLLYGCLIIFLFHLNILSQQPILKAHAHNDYEHERPLFMALENGFISVEADVHLIEDVLYVSHDRPKSLFSTPNLEELYLQPLKKHIDQNGGYVYPYYEDFFYLMIDIKTAADVSYPVLRNLLNKYSSIISVVRNKRDQTNKPVKVLLSGSDGRPVKELLSDEVKYAGLDGRPHELVERYPIAFVPVISEDYNKYLSWNGTGAPDEKELEYLINMIEETHRQHKKVRLWASPDIPKVWELLLSIGVDFINTDRIKEFKEFMDNRFK